jgi:hypothetical protein
MEVNLFFLNHREKVESEEKKEQNHREGVESEEKKHQKEGMKGEGKKKNKIRRKDYEVNIK